MRVLHVTSTYLPDKHGGIEEVIRQICLNSVPYGVESRIFTLSSNPIPEIIQSHGIDIFRASKSFEIASCGFSLQALIKFKEVVQWADIIHYHFPWPFADLLHVFCKVKKKSIVTYHSDVIRQKKLNILYKPLMHNFLRSVDSIVSTSNKYAETSSVLCRYKKNTEIIPIGINENSFPIPSDSDLISMQNKVGVDFFLFIGSLRLYKGLNFLLEAIRNTELQCVIAGNGVVEKKLIKQAKQIGLSNVHFLGQVDEVEKVALLKLCRAVVLTSNLRSEAFGVSLVEGAMFEKPLISTELGTGTSYINIDSKTGFVVPPSEAQSLRKAMLSLSSDLLLSKKMGCAARTRYEELFTGDKMGKQYFQLYKSLLQSQVL